MNRKNFLLSTTLTAISLTALGSIVKTRSGNFKGDCETTDDILGPFYRAGAPVRSDMTYEGLKGNRIEIKGKVFGSDCKTPIANTLVEIWHCDTLGEYDNKSKDFLHRASQLTNQKGEYSFITILPGKYLNGELYRPAHIHFRITVKNHKDIVSQIYFKGDPHITADPWASQEKAKERILELEPENIKGGLTVNFDIYLQEV